MNSLCGFNFCGDINTLDPTPSNVKRITETKIENAIYDHINLNTNVNKEYSQSIPQWNYDTILDCTFDETIEGGNINLTLEQITSIRLKRRKIGEFNWTKIDEISITDYDQFYFTKFDKMCPNGEEYEYAVVPTLNNIEGNYIISSKVKSCFEGVFISDVDSMIKLYSNVQYGDTTNNMAIGSLQPIGAKYPIIMSNSEMDYQSGSLSGQVMGYDYENTKVVDRKDIANQTNDISKILKNNKPKIIKDWNGNVWLVMITSSPNISYNNSYGMGVTTIGFNWTEQGKYDNEEDLIANGFIQN